MRRSSMLFVLPGLAFSAAASADLPLPPPSSAQSFYELHVTLPGTRSQGVRGILMDAAGKPVDFGRTIDPIETPIGRFEAVGCTYLWSVCGFLRYDGYSPDHHGITNAPARTGPTLYRVLRPASAAAPAWRGELLDAAGQPPAKAERRIETPMGVFVRFDGCFNAQRWSGWIPLLWLPEDKRPD